MARRRTVAGFAALAAITGTLVFGGAIAAQADAGLEITTTDVVWSATPFAINGTVDTTNGLNPIEIREGTDPAGALLCPAVTFLTPTTWTCTPAPTLAPGSYVITAWQDGPPADRLDTETLLVRVPQATASSPNPLDVVQGDGFDIQGFHTYPGSTVTVDTLGYSAPICTTVDDGAAPLDSWDCGGPWTDDLPPGTYDFPVTQSLDAAPQTAPLLYRVNVSAAPVLITAPSTGLVWTATPTSVSGIVQDTGLGDVTVTEGGAPRCTATPAADGSWSCTPATAFAAGDHTLQADQYPFTTERTFRVLVPNPVMDQPNPYEAPYSTQTPFSGNTNFYVPVNPGSYYVQVESLDLGWSCTAYPTGPEGLWACDPFDTNFPDYPIEFGRAYTLTYRIQDGPLQAVTPGQFTFTMGQPSPSGPVIDDPVDTAELETGPGNWLTVSGRAPLAYSVNLEVDGSTWCYGMTVDYNAEWSCTLDLAVGEHELVAYQDQDGSGVFSDPVDITVVEPSGTLPPALTCGFSPNGGFTVGSPQQMANFELSRVYLMGGSSDGMSFGLPGNCDGSTGSPLPLDDGDLYFDKLEECLPTCSQAGLEPGLYEVYYERSESDPTPGMSLEPHSYAFTIPEAPSITDAASTTNSVVLQGTATPADIVRIVRSNGATLCTATATGSGAWACQFPKSAAASARAIAVDAPSGGMSAYSAARSIPVLEVPVVKAGPGPIQAPEPSVALVNWFLQFGGDLKNLKPGDKFTLNVSGMPEGTEIEIWIHSTPQLLGTATGTGVPMTLNLQVPMDIESGDHEIKMVAVTPLGTNYFYTDAATVIGGAEPTKPLDTVPDTEESPDGPGGGSGDRADPAAPSGISGTLAPLQQIVANPTAIVIAGGLALALLFLVALPTELLNSSLSSNTSRLGRVYGTVDSAMTRAQDWLIKVTHSRAVVAVLLVIVVAFIYGFVDPGFGFDIVSLRLVLSLGIAFFILSFVASWISGMIVRRAWGASGYIALQPSIILFAVVGVIVARVLEFSPGFLVGLAIGLELLQASRRVAARAVFVQIAVVVGLALVAWVGYSLFTPGDDFFGMLTEDMLVALTAEGLTGALIAVFPLHFLDGRQLWDVSKRLWVAAFLLVGVAFSLLVLPTAIEGTDVRDYGTWLIVFGVFAAVSLAIWFVFVRAAKRAEPADDAEHEKVDA